ncbi:protein DBF4 homolog A [Trichonephila inaurata madagascariensis]|uniref:Protein DBF4 homolog A n=1 Tax=Trichonephila inaurata madagascariensis TaxID=2747483 RepID=A0A8X6YUB4_9ARAC|nr:protein DBF4 homolog A [Trichonephila inaurata madagascariensis]
MKGVLSSKPFEKKSFYLDLKGSPYEASLAKDLKRLGARHEVLFSKDVSFVVSNRVPLRQLAPKIPQWSPLTPKSMCPSPQLLSDNSLEYMDSSTYAVSPSTDQNFHKSRGMALVNIAKQKPNPRATDLLENCKRWGVKVYHVEKILSKVKKLKNMISAELIKDLPKRKGQKKVQEHLTGARKLLPPFIKIEDMNRNYKPIFREFSSWTDVIDPSLSFNISQVHKQFKKTGSLIEITRPVFGEISVNVPTTTNVMKTSRTKSFTKLTETGFLASNSTISTVSTVVHTKEKAKESNAYIFKMKTDHRRVKTSYCEICHKNYKSLDEHLKTEKHKNFMSDPINFLPVQNVLASFPKREEILFSDLCLDHGNLDMSYSIGDYPERSQNLKYDDCIYQSQFNITHDATNDNLATEPYSFLDPEVISPSCSSPDSVALPFLQDSVEKCEQSSQHCGEVIKELAASKKRNLDLGSVELVEDSNSSVMPQETTLSEYCHSTSIVARNNFSTTAVNTLREVAAKTIEFTMMNSMIVNAMDVDENTKGTDTLDSQNGETLMKDKVYLTGHDKNSLTLSKLYTKSSLEFEESCKNLVSDFKSVPVEESLKFINCENDKSDGSPGLKRKAGLDFSLDEYQSSTDTSLIFENCHIKRKQNKKAHYLNEENYSFTRSVNDNEDYMRRLLKQTLFSEKDVFEGYFSSQFHSDSSQDSGICLQIIPYKSPNFAKNFDIVKPDNLDSINPAKPFDTMNNMSIMHDPGLEENSEFGDVVHSAKNALLNKQETGKLNTPDKEKCPQSIKLNINKKYAQFNTADCFVFESKYFRLNTQNLQVLHIFNVEFQTCLNLKHCFMRNEVLMNELSEFQGCSISADSSPVKKRNMTNHSSLLELKEIDCRSKRWNILLLKTQITEIKSEFIHKIMPKCGGTAFVDINNVKDNQCKYNSSYMVSLLYLVENSSQEFLSHKLKRNYKSAFLSNFSNESCQNNCFCCSNSYSLTSQNEEKNEFMNSFAFDEPLNLCLKENENKEINSFHSLFPFRHQCSDSCVLNKYIFLNKSSLFERNIESSPSILGCPNCCMNFDLNCPVCVETLHNYPNLCLDKTLKPFQLPYHAQNAEHNSLCWPCYEFDNRSKCNFEASGNKCLQAIDNQECINHNSVNISDSVHENPLPPVPKENIPVLFNISSVSEAFREQKCPSSEYVIVDDADFDSLSGDEWEPLKSTVDSLCHSLCSEDSDCTFI